LFPKEISNLGEIHSELNYKKACSFWRLQAIETIVKSRKSVQYCKSQSSFSEIHRLKSISLGGNKVEFSND